MARKRSKAPSRKRRLHLLNQELAQKSDSRIAEYSRQVDYDDMYNAHYEKSGEAQILKPPYLPGRMYELYEESGILQACVEAYVTNVDGMGWDVIPKEGVAGDEGEGSDIEKQKVIDLFTSPNPEESFTTLRKSVRRDYEVTGNGYIEVIRSVEGEPTMLFWADATRVRKTPRHADQVEVRSILIRGGRPIDVVISRRFCRYVMIYEKQIRYFKEFGDPRIMNTFDGAFFDVAPEVDQNGLMTDGRPFKLATELLHFKHGSGPYGIPRWIGTLLAVMGSSRAEYVNFDLFDNQGIPPLVVTLSGGQLTEESFDDLLTMFKKAKGAQNFHKLLILEAESTMTDMSGKETAPKLEVKNLAEFRKEDAMFLQYLEDSRKIIRQYGFRLPGLFVGEQSDYNYATAKICRETTEEQVFVPERKAFDERINMTLVRALGVFDFVIKTRAPVINSTEEVIQLMPSLIENGAFTINELIHFVNEHFGLSLLPYEGDNGEVLEWANEPIPFVMIEKKNSMVMSLPTFEEDENDEAGIAKSEQLHAALTDLEGVLKKYARHNIEQLRVRQHPSAIAV